MTDKPKEEIDYKKKYDELLVKYKETLAEITDIGFQIQAFARSKKEVTS